MKEYGNYLAREDVALPPTGNYIGTAVEEAKVENCLSKKFFIMKNCIKTLSHEARNFNEVRWGCKNISSDKYVFYVVLDYNGILYYWWELFKSRKFQETEEKTNKLDSMCGSGDGLFTLWLLGELYEKEDFIKATLETPIRNHPSMGTYVLFATDDKQSPLMCTGQFGKEIKLDKIY